MKTELIDFLKKAKSIKPNWSINELIEREHEINSINSEHQVEAPNVIENEQKENICRTEECIWNKNRYRTCGAIHIEPCLQRQI